MADDELNGGVLSEERAIGRVFALSDGVFAIALTLLVLNIRLPAGTPTDRVAHALRDMAPMLGAYALSFTVIARFWLSHHRLYGVVARIDPYLTVLNLVQLACIAILPFPAQLLGDHASAPASAVVYAASLGLAGAASAVAWWHVLRTGLADPRVPRQHLVHGMWRAAAPAAVFFASIPIAFVSAVACEWSWASLIVLFAVLRRRFGPVHLQLRKA